MTTLTHADPQVLALLADREREAAASREQIVANVLGRDVTRGELATAFDLVAPRNHWKERIDTTVELAEHREMAMIREAVIFYTGSVPTFHAVAIVGRKCRYRVRAAGYYATCGA